MDPNLCPKDTMSSVVKHSMVVGGKLKFKGSQRKDKKTSKSESDRSAALPSNVSNQKNESSVSISEIGEKKSLLFMTDAQKIHKEKRKATEEKELKKFIKTSHRDRIEKFNLLLGQMTEHNDIPRISAAGNG